MKILKDCDLFYSVVLQCFRCLSCITVGTSNNTQNLHAHVNPCIHVNLLTCKDAYLCKFCTNKHSFTFGQTQMHIAANPLHTYVFVSTCTHLYSTCVNAYIIAIILKFRNSIFRKFSRETKNCISLLRVAHLLKAVAYSGSEYDRKCYPITSSIVHSMCWSPI